MNKTANALYENANRLGLIIVLTPFGNNIKVRLPLSKSFCNQSTQELELSVRSRNGLMRVGADTIDKLIDLIMEDDGLSHIRNLGRKSINEIKTFLLVKAYEDLSDRERLAFWSDFVSENNLPENIETGGALHTRIK